jgi:long-chain acyl-CoA synthetase
VPIGPSHGDTGEVADRVGAVAAISVDHDHGLPVGLDQHDIALWWAAPPTDSPPAAFGGGEDLAVLARARADRAVMLSHRSILAAVEAIGRLDDRRVRDADRVLQVLPMYHVAGWVVAFLPTTIVGGATVIPEVGFDSATISIGAPDGALRGSQDVVAAGRRAAESAVAAAGEHDVTVVPGAPGFFHHLVGMDGAQRSLATVRLLTSGTAPLDTDDFGAVQTLIGHPVWEGYGLSEAASVVASTLMTDEPRHGSVGKPLTGIELRIVGPDGQDVNPGDSVQPTETEAAELSDPLDVMVEAPDAGEVGRIAIRGATLFSGYWPGGHGGPGADGWFVTGDIGFVDDDGELHLVDRASETVTVAGFTVYPREVEQVLGLHPGVAEAAVIGVPVAGGAEEVAAVLVARADAVLTVTDLADFVDSRLPAFKRPVVYQLAPSLPRTEVGRLDRGAVLRNFTRTPNATLPRLVAVAPSPEGAVTVNGDQAAAVAGETASGPSEDDAVDVRPEQVADLDELGVRLPASGTREERGDQDTDEDLF